MSAQAMVGIFVSPCLAHWVIDWIPLGGRVYLFKFRLQKRSLFTFQVYVPNAEAQYQPFLDEVVIALQKVTPAESIVLLSDFNANVGTDDKTWKGVIGRQGTSEINKNGKCLLLFFATNGRCIINTFVQHKEIYKYTWYRNSLEQYFVIDFCFVSANLFFSVVDVCVK